MSETLPDPIAAAQHALYEASHGDLDATRDEIRAAIAAAVAAERERCAKLCEDDAYEIGAALAAAIRAQP